MATDPTPTKPVPLAACANCDLQWFRLEDATLPLGHGVFCMNINGRITGYTGTLHCARCGEVYEQVGYDHDLAAMVEEWKEASDG